MLKILKISVFSAICLLACGIFLFTRFAYKQTDGFEKPADIHLTANQSLQSLATDLKNKAVITSEPMFIFLIKVLGSFSKAKAGRYRFDQPVSPLEIIDTLVQGRVFRELLLELTIPEGQTAAFVVQKLTEKGFSKEEFWKLFKDKAFLASLEIDSFSLEGYIYPATYQFYDQLPTAKEFWAKTVHEFFKKIPEDLLAKGKEKGLSLQQIVTFASLIEKETANDDERNMISEVIWNRLKAGEPLGIDASIIYGIKDYKGDIKTVHLKDRSNLYNSRIHKNLPPGPIASPSKKSLSAVFSPTSFGYYYYVLEPGEKKSHYFSKTLKEHNAHVKILTDHLKKKS